jgi:hypothetical protein
MTRFQVQAKFWALARRLPPRSAEPSSSQFAVECLLAVEDTDSSRNDAGKRANILASNACNEEPMVEGWHLE